MGAAVIVSAVGLAIHNAREFGPAALGDLSTGFIPILGISIILFLLWWLVRGGQKVGAIGLLVIGLLHLIGGAILSVLPLGFLPFVPEQSAAHYLSRVIYGVTQLPLIGLAWQASRRKV
jgi:hypothetical protein